MSSGRCEAEDDVGTCSASQAKRPSVEDDVLDLFLPDSVTSNVSGVPPSERRSTPAYCNTVVLQRSFRWPMPGLEGELELGHRGEARARLGVERPGDASRAMCQAPSTHASAMASAMVTGWRERVIAEAMSTASQLSSIAVAAFQSSAQ